VSSPESPSERTIEVAGGEVLVRTAGTGPDAVVLHHDIGPTGWTPFHAALARSFTVWAPDLPGYGASPRPEWARNLRDMAALACLTVDTLGLGDITLVGLGYGGWIAAEAATFAAPRLRRLVLAGAMGMKPEEGEIYDQFMVGHEVYVKTGFKDEAAFVRYFGEQAPSDDLVAWDIAREMTTRVAWKPYMFNRALPHLLRNVAVPTLVVHGDGDHVVPMECAQAYAGALPNARLETVADAGHWIDLEQPEALARLVVAHEMGD